MPPKPEKPTIFKSPVAILSVLAIIVCVAIILNLDHIASIISYSEIQQEKQELQQKITILEKELEELTEKPPGDAPATAKKESEPPLSIDLSNATCQELDKDIQKFFKYLDKQQYLTSYNLENDTQTNFKNVIDKLLENPPIVVRETDSLFTILTNTAHFYRVLGKNNVLMIRDIIIREADTLESTLALFDQWSQTGNQCLDVRTNIRLPLNQLYEYAGFFLSTLGGQSYLFRRNSHIRLLIKYYSVMILNRANTEIINRHGIDITPPLESLINEIEIGETLIYKDQYLRKLRDLQSKYQTNYVNIEKNYSDN